MNIVYEKNITFEYNCDRMDDLTLRKLAGSLAKKGLYLVGMHDKLNVANYGYTNVETNKKTFEVTIPQFENWSMVCNYRSDAVSVIEAFEEIHPNIIYEKVETITIKKEWAEVQGNHITMIDSEDTLFSTPSRNISYTLNEFEYDLDIAGELTMVAKFEDSYFHGLKLSFRIEWIVDDKQTPSMIEKVLDDMLLSHINSIKQTIDRVLKTKAFGIDVLLEPNGNVEMSCYSNTKVDVKQECSLESRQKLGGSQ